MMKVESFIKAHHLPPEALKIFVDVILALRKDSSFSLQIEGRLISRTIFPGIFRSKGVNVFHQLNSKLIDYRNRERSL